MRPPTRLNRFAPIFPVADLRRALAHYQALGFETLAYQGGDDSAVLTASTSPWLLSVGAGNNKR